MKIIDLVQGSNEWLEWRKGIITATDAASIMGENPWCSAYKCWQRKLGLIPEEKENHFMRRGKEDEPIAREMFMQETGIEVFPACIQSEYNDVMGASLDGLSIDHKCIVEIKSQSFDKIINGVPKHHYHQIQHQLLCTDGIVEKCFYVSYWGGNIKILEVVVNPFWINEYLKKMNEFFNNILYKTPPAMVKGDYEANTDIDFSIVSTEYREIDRQIKELTIKKERLKEALIDLSHGKNIEGYGVKIFKKISKGRIDYAEAIEVLNIRDDQLEPFRKPDSESWCVLVDSN